MPEDSGDNTRGRDAQFELFVGAIGDRVGFDVSHLGEGQPDWDMAARVRRWSLEAKRAKSSDAVTRQVKKAAEQIKKSNVGDIIALDVSAVEGADTRRLAFCLSDENMEKARLEMGDAILKHGLPDMKRAIGDAPVGLIIVHDYLIRPAGIKPNGDSVPWGLQGMWWSYYLEPPNSTQYQRYQEFWQLWGLGLPNL